MRFFFFTLNLVQFWLALVSSFNVGRWLVVAIASKGCAFLIKSPAFALAPKLVLTLNRIKLH